MHTPTDTHTNTHARTHALTHTHTHTLTHTNTYTHNISFASFQRMDVGKYLTIVQHKVLKVRLITNFTSL